VIFDILRHNLNSMLNNFFITRDAPSFIAHYLDSLDINLPEINEQIHQYSNGKAIRYEQWWKLLDDLNAQLEQDALGVKIGSTIGSVQCGVLGYLFRTSLSVLEALACYQRYERLLYAGSKVDVIRTNDSLTLVWPSEQGLSRQLSDSLLLSSLVNIIREVLDDPSVSPTSISFTQEIPNSDKIIYEDFFGCKPLEQKKNLSITLNIKDLEKAIPYHDRTLHTLLGQQADALVEQLPSAHDIVEIIKQTIAQGLHHQRYSADSVASAMNVSSRTLHRKINNAGTTFRDILREVRQTLTIRYLSDESLSITEIALLLGYSEQSAFNRAHRKWFEMTPKKHREQLVFFH
jgi:AraC-like DNA-binding protein